MARFPKREDTRAIRRSLEEARDEKLLRVVATIDTMDERGCADALLDPLRSRLAMLRPPRPLRFERLLFFPLEPVIVAGPSWRPDSPNIPRHALPPLTGTVRNGLGDSAAEFDTLIAGHTSHDNATVACIGNKLWIRAAEVLADTPLPTGWADAGLRPALYKPLAQAISTAWRWHTRLQAIGHRARNAGSSQAAIATLLAGLGREPSLTQAMMMALLLARLPQAASLIHNIIGGFGDGAEQAGLRNAVGRAVEGLTTQLESGLETKIAATSLADSGQEVRRLVSLLDELYRRASMPERRTGVAELCRRLDAVCRTRFRVGLQDELLVPLQAQVNSVDGATQTQFEQAARNLRELETHARRLSGAGFYDGLLDAAAKTVQRAAAQGTLTLPRQVRLVEILSGTDAAMAVLDAAQV